MSRHPVILDQLTKLLPPAPYHATTRLVRDLAFDAEARRRFVTTIEEAFAIRIDDRRIPEWKTLDDVAGAIADCLALEVA